MNGNFCLFSIEFLYRDVVESGHHNTFVLGISASSSGVASRQKDRSEECRIGWIQKFISSWLEIIKERNEA